MFEKKFGRRLVREKVLQALYAYEMNKDGLTAIIHSTLNEIEIESDKNFGKDLIYKVINNVEKIDDKIKSRVNNWEMDRIALIDKLLLRMGIAELLYFDDIPPKVSINEVIEISKEFSTGNSGKFINGILDAILNELKSTGELRKIGRGLLDEPIHKKSEE